MKNKLQMGKGRSAKNNCQAISVVQARDDDPGLGTVEVEQHVRSRRCFGEQSRLDSGLAIGSKEKRGLKDDSQGLSLSLGQRLVPLSDMKDQEGAVLEEKIMTSRLDIKFKVFIRHTSGDVKQAIGQMDLVFKEEIRAGNKIRK